MLKDDALKQQLCQKNNVALIVVPFFVSIKSIQDYVISELAKFGIMPPNTESFPPGLVAASALKKLRQIAANHEGELLSECYQGCSEKLRWKCKNSTHPEFMATPSAVTTGTWCKKCAGDKASESYRISIDQVQKWAKACDGELIEDGLFDSRADVTFALSDQAKFRCSKCNDQPIRIVRQVKEGRLCLCSTNKKRIDRKRLIEKLSERSMVLLSSGEFFRGRTCLTIQCSKCGWERDNVKVAYVMNGQIGCKNCSRNAPISIEKCRELGVRIGFHLISTEVRDGKNLLLWSCMKCGERIEMPYRKMRNVRTCKACARSEARMRLGLVL